MVGHYTLVRNGKFIEWGWAAGCGIKLTEDAVEISPELYSLLNLCRGDLKFLQEKVDELRKIVSYDPSHDIAIGDEVKLKNSSLAKTATVEDIFAEDVDGAYFVSCRLSEYFLGSRYWPIEKLELVRKNG